MANSRKDIGLLNNDIAFAGGDLFIVAADDQHIIDTINAFPGWWKEYPLDGVGVMAYTKAPTDLQELNRKIRTELTNDGYSLRQPSVVLDPAGQLTINPDVEW